MLTITPWMFKGSAERPGLAVLAIAEFLSVAEKNGKSIAVSFYEVDHQERAMDLLNPEKPPILVFEDRGRIQFKGLTQVEILLTISAAQFFRLEKMEISKLESRKVKWGLCIVLLSAGSCEIH